MPAITYSCIAPLVMGFGTIGLYLFYFAYRYNILYVSNASIDTQGRCYTRGLQHLTVGCYLSMVCLIGLFAMASGSNQLAVGPLILMVIFLIFVILYHMSMNTAMEPLLNYLPKNLEAEEEALLAADRNTISKSTSEDLHAPTASTDAPRDSGVNVDNGYNGVGNVDSAEKGLTATSNEPKPNFLTKFLRPDKYANYQQLLAHTSRVIPITDEDAYLDEKCKIQWNEEKGEPPIYEEKISY
ncbi:phosphate metabolism protein 7 [Elasticomyces elasticus]|nr:phosphate metabolism protein 7 [Elasticomyces elasticus]